MDNKRPRTALPPAGEPAQVKGMSPNAPLTPEGRRRLCKRIDAGAPLRDVQVFARHADPRTTTHYDRARLNLDRHAAYVVAGYLTGGA